MLTEEDIVLITYPDQFRCNDKPLRCLKNELKKLKGTINWLHILPFFPFSSDDGFSVIDYYNVKEEYGTWEDIEDIGKDFNLIFDAVINHVSTKHEWFQKFLACEEPYKDYFITVDPNVDLSMVARPRDSPLLTRFNTKEGEKWVWTTFSQDQVDLNYKNHRVFDEIVRILLFYASKGAKMIRLDAVAYLWKEIGTRCINLHQTHQLIKNLRTILPEDILFLSETNVPNDENLSYLSKEESQLVYQFALPPLVMHALISENSEHLNSFLENLMVPEKGTYYFNFLASHDGIGLRPVENILNEKEINILVGNTFERGGKVSYRDTKEGKKPYELNISYYDAMGSFEKFMLSQSILLTFPGIPGIYIHSLYGTRNWHGGTCNRSINRMKFNYPYEYDKKVYNEYVNMIKIRKERKEFHPESETKVVKINNSIFAYERKYKNKKIICLHNLSGEKFDTGIKGYDLIRDTSFRGTIEPYSFAWII